MKTLTICLITVLFFTSCGRADQTKNQAAEGPGEGVAEKPVQQQELAVKQKYLEKGMEIANATQAELLKVVQGAVAQGGPAYAVKYCNIEALELKDSLAALNNCTIQRLSTKYRNPSDKPVTDTEIAQLQFYGQLHGEGKALKPTVYIVGEELEYYQPILIGSGACLLCHGDPETQIAGKTMRTIKELYPDDRATGYAMNDFRGVWKITFLH